MQLSGMLSVDGFNMEKLGLVHAQPLFECTTAGEFLYGLIIWINELFPFPIWYTWRGFPVKCVEHLEIELSRQDNKVTFLLTNIM